MTRDTRTRLIQYIFQAKTLNTTATYVFAMVTTIQVSQELMSTLKKRKQYDKESYEEIIWNLIEDTMELNKETKQQIEHARTEIASGKFFTHQQVINKVRSRHV